MRQTRSKNGLLLAMATLAILLIFATAILAIWLLAQARSGQPEIVTENRQGEDSGATHQASPVADDEAVGGVVTINEPATTTEGNSQDSATETPPSEYLPETLTEPPPEQTVPTEGLQISEADDDIQDPPEDPGYSLLQRYEMNRPAHLAAYVDSEANITGIRVSWLEPSANVNDSPDYHLFQWREYHEDFSSGRQQEFQPTDQGLSGDGMHRKKSVFIPDLKAYKLRVILVYGLLHVDSREALVITPINILTEHIEKRIVEQYNDEHPWLSEAWNYMRQSKMPIEHNPELEYIGWVQAEVQVDYPLSRTRASYLQFSRLVDISDTLHIHELAHIYTFTNDLSKNPGGLAIAQLYFSRLAANSGSRDCKGFELYADAATAFVIPGGETGYWEDGCPFAGSSQSTPEALEVVGQAFAGRMPDWLHEAYGDADGGLNLAHIWEDVRAIEEGWLRVSVVYRLRNQFGGYCDAALVGATVFDANSNLINPWLDGGCR